MRLKGSNDEEYKGEVKGGLFAIYNEKGENVGNFKDINEAVKLGGYSVIAEAAASPEAGADGNTGADTAHPTDTPGKTGQDNPDTPPNGDPKADTPQTEKTPA